MAGTTVVLLLVGGCPEDVDEPDIPPGVVRCEVTADCNELRCGVLRACVAGACEAPDAGTVFIPCQDASSAPSDGGP